MKLDGVDWWDDARLLWTLFYIDDVCFLCPGTQERVRSLDVEAGWGDGD